MQRSLRMPGGFSRNGTIILSYTLVKGLTNALQGLIYNLFLLSLHFDSTLIGLLDAMPAVTVLLVSVPMGVLADRVGRKRLLIVCATLNGLTVLGLALFTTVWWQVTFGLINGVVASFYWIAYPAILYDSASDESRQRLFSVNSMLLLGIGSLGYLLGGAVTVAAGSLLHQSPQALEPERWGMLTIVILDLLGVPALLFLQERRYDPAVRQERPHYDLALFIRLLAPDALLSFGAGAVLSFNQLYFVLVFGLSPGTVGLFLTLAGVAGALGALVSPPLTLRLGAARAAILLQGSAVPLIAALALAPGAAIALLVYAAWSVVRSAIDPTYTGFVMGQVPEGQRSTLSGLYAVTWAVGFGIGPIATGALRGATHAFTIPFLLAAACYGVATLGLYLFFGRRAVGSTVADRGRRAPAR